jgi:hypothetical protein
MFWWWGPWGWLAGLLTAIFWIALIVGAVILLRRELPAFQHRMSAPPALHLLEERYARGEITREEFLHRREVLLAQPPVYQQQPPTQQPPVQQQPPAQQPPAQPPPPPATAASSGAEPTQPLQQPEDTTT